MQRKIEIERDRERAARGHCGRSAAWEAELTAINSTRDDADTAQTKCKS